MQHGTCSLLPVALLLGSGVNTEASTAFGITDTFVGSIADRRTVFSLLPTHTDMQHLALYMLITCTPL